MGASQSRSGPSPEGGKAFYNEVPIQLSGELVSKLANQAEDPSVNPARQSLLDNSVRQRILSDVAKLKEEEADVRHQIELALERENLDRERSMAGGASAASADESTVGEVKSSAVLLGDLEEVRQKVDRYKIRQDLVDHPDLKARSEALVQCYRSRPAKTLDCYREVSEFQHAVAELEHKYVESLRQ